ncbi:MAG: RdgB/HAM1 family non-canonical purine NTP pyrophosphatase [Gemmatimonadaceae bacterium]
MSDDTAATILLATRSAGKLRELRALFEAAGLHVQDLEEAGIEEGDQEHALEVFDTFEENALAKARHFHAITGGRVVADDSGLEVEALAGAPGVRSKRWSGRTELTGTALDEANNALLQRSLAGVADRRARYVCVAAYVDGARELVFRGEVSGTITSTRLGSGGFGYDPYFIADETGRSFGEMSREEKQRISHRGRAFAALLHALGTGRGEGFGRQPLPVDSADSTV